jgi:hypothetical protein
LPFNPSALARFWTFNPATNCYSVDFESVCLTAFNKFQMQCRHMISFVLLMIMLDSVRATHSGRKSLLNMLPPSNNSHFVRHRKFFS